MSERTTRPGRTTRSGTGVPAFPAPAAAVTRARTRAARAAGSFGPDGFFGAATLVDPADGDRVEATLGRREIVVVAAIVIGLSRLIAGPPAWALGLIAAALVWLGARRVVAARSVGPIQPEATLLPATAAFAGVAVLQLVPVGIGLVPAVAAAAALIEIAIALEARIAARPMGFTPLDRTLLIGVSLIVAFVGYTGVAGLLPGVLGMPLAPGEPRVVPPLADLVTLAGVDAAITFVLGYRLAALRAPLWTFAARTALTYAAAIAIAAGFFSAAALPRFLGPALLTLVLFLWESFVGAEAPTRRDPRFIWQVTLLAILAVVVVAWNLLIPR